MIKAQGFIDNRYNDRMETNFDFGTEKVTLEQLEFRLNVPHLVRKICAGSRCIESWSPLHPRNGVTRIQALKE